MEVGFAYTPSLDAYDLGPEHPFRPERVTLAVKLMEAYGLIAEGALRPIEFQPATREQLERVHDGAYIDTVIRASGPGGLWPPERGIGPGDTPAFPGMHDAAALVAGATSASLRTVLDGRYTRAFSPAGGLHHAHRDRAAGFCVYNDLAVAIADALARDPDLRVLYVDIDAHHGDGVQEAFYTGPRVLTISLHESGQYLYPGTGFIEERGSGAGRGTAINVPMPPLATDECYLLAFDEVVAPAARAFKPGVIVAQCGTDAHWSDPLTSLGVTLAGFSALYARIVALADQLCAGRLLACGGGGYAWTRVVPRAWTMLAAILVERELPEDLPAAWLAALGRYTDAPPASLTGDPAPSVPAGAAHRQLATTEAVIAKLRDLGAV
ncbi:MAG: acetoin utilization protein AcuC [Actinobacteria bacterium]|nr:acetoin utilization protein AcuC [Actinomycetota bacterium]